MVTIESSPSEEKEKVNIPRPDTTSARNSKKKAAPSVSTPANNKRTKKRTNKEY